jgi:hypothetical protein
MTVGAPIAGPAGADDGDAFAASRELFASTVGWLDGIKAGALDYADLEAQLDAKGSDLLRQLHQDHTALHTQREPARDQPTHEN